MPETAPEHHHPDCADRLSVDPFGCQGCATTHLEAA